MKKMLDKWFNLTCLDPAKIFHFNCCDLLAVTVTVTTQLYNAGV